MRQIRIAFLFTLIMVIVPVASIFYHLHGTGVTVNTSVSTMQLYAQKYQKPDTSVQSEKAQPSDASTDLYKVMCVILIVWIGLALFLFRLDRKIAGLEKELNKMH
jgi:CcmD family protein